MSARLGLVGGYLGSGKSTLVNRLLAGVLPGRTAVVVNDFGSVNIDAALIASASEDTIELTNGCVCCQITDDVTRTMSALAARTDLDHVVCEVSGVGDPRQLASWQEFPGFVPGPLLVCADATSIRRLLTDEYVGDTVQRQLTAAEVVLVTKTDLTSSSEVQESATTCRVAAPGARVVLQDPADPDATALEAFGTEPGRSAAERPSPAEPDDHAELHSSLTLDGFGPIDVDLLARALGRQVRVLVRAKGVVLDPDGRWHDLQLSSGRVDLRPHAVDRPAPERPALVLIAAGPDAEDDLATAAAELGRVLGRT
ncbi:CobW family GTP-binding protein [Aeromicrobium sp. CF4.19]|uniref:CobW family GTP-binding protein n=1 Tax=Aeromicrobium sp. CF4.19 TaxID=3373082 RepID=UPI003EE59B4F